MEIKETVNEIGKKRIELQKQLQEIFNKFTKETGLTIDEVSPNALFETASDTGPVDYRVRVDIKLV